jgi:hypothetical protein
MLLAANRAAREAGADVPESADALRRAGNRCRRIVNGLPGAGNRDCPDTFEAGPMASLRECDEG